MKHRSTLLQHFGYLLLDADSRLLVPVLLVSGIFVWKATVIGLGVYALLALFAFASLSSVTQESGSRLELLPGRSSLRSFLVFVFIWMTIKGILDAIGGMPLQQVVVGAVALGVRLAVLFTLGLSLCMAASTRKLGVALAWYLRPILRMNAWRAALAFTLMIHFIPMSFATFSSVRKRLEYRFPDMPRRKRIVPVITATLRILSQKTWSQALAVAARDLDRPEAWTAPALPNVGAILIIGLATAVLGFVAMH